MSAANFRTPAYASMKRRFLRFVASSVGLLPVVAFACPICNTDTGRQVRASIFGEDFWSTLATVLSPFPVLLLVLAVMHFGWPRLGKRPSPSSQIETTPQSNTHAP